MKKVTGLGGVFFKCDDPNKMKDWYKNHLGLDTTEYGVSFEWRDKENSEDIGFTQWNTFSRTTDYFEPSQKDFMLNYRVANLEELIKQLKIEGVTILDEIVTYPYGKFAHILDMEGNKIQLWEPGGSFD